MKTWKKWLIAVFSILLLAGITLGVVWVVDNWSAITSNTTLYTQEDLDNAYNKGLNDAGYDVIVQYQEQVADLQIELQNKEITIGNLTDQLNDALENGGLKDDEIEDLKKDIADLQAEITAKQEQIEGLQDDIKFYQELLEAYEDSDKLRVTFTMVDNGKERNYDVQVVEPNGYLSEVITPDRADFEGWSLTKGGELIDDLTTIQVTENMTIYGMCTNTVTFMVNGEEYATQEVSYGKYATDVEVSLTGYTLEGWSLTENGETITFNTTPIIKDTTFYAVLNGKGFTTWEEKIWNYGDCDASDITAENIWTDGKNIYCSTLKWDNYILNQETSTWEEKTWNVRIQGNYTWTDGEEVYYSFGEGKQYILNKETSTWEEKTWYGYQPASSKHIWTDTNNIYYSNGNRQYVLNQGTSTWETITWNGVSNPVGDEIWMVGENVYYCDSDDIYVLHKETSTWIETSFELNCLDGSTESINVMDADGIWTDGENVYYSYYSDQYIYDKETSTWKEKTWTGLTSFTGKYIWTDGTNIYYSDGYVLV
mgnify:CR=1 FL=1